MQSSYIVSCHTSLVCVKWFVSVSKQIIAQPTPCFLTFYKYITLIKFLSVTNDYKHIYI